MIKRYLVIGIIVSLVCMSITSSNAFDNVKKSSIPVSNGNILYVGGIGPDNYTRIQDAIDNASDGDTVFVYNGIYYENVVINKSLNLVGEDRNTTKIDGQGKEPPISTVKVISSYVNISGFTVQNPGWGRGFHLVDSTNNNTFTNNIFVNQSEGIRIVRCSDNIITGNLFLNNEMGIELSVGTTDTIVSNNVFSNSILDGIITAGDSYRNQILNNKIENNGRSGIRLQDAFDYVIDSNFISNNAHSGIYFYESDKNQIINNTLTKNNVGIYFREHSYYNNISGNNLSNFLGILIQYSTYNIFSDNMFFNDGLFIKSTPNTYINNSINNKPLILLIGESDKVIDNVEVGQIILMNCNKITIKNEDISNTAIGIELYSCSNCIISKNKITNNNFYGIYIKGNNNVISYNSIKKNRMGLFWWGTNNSVKMNNFILNKRGASFHITEGGDDKTEWRRNYWNRPRILPKPVFGLKEIRLMPDSYGGYVTIPIIWFGVDIFPAKIPHII